MIIGLISCFLFFFYVDLYFCLINLALLICTENSFWHQNTTFLDAFSDALQFYQSSETRKRVEDRLNQQQIYSENIKGKAVLQYFQSKKQDVRQEEYKTALIDLILAHRLGTLTFFYYILHLISLTAKTTNK